MNGRGRVRLAERSKIKGKRSFNYSRGFTAGKKEGRIQGMQAIKSALIEAGQYRDNPAVPIINKLINEELG